MVSWSPDTPSRPPGGDYAYSDNVVTGFSLNHISGPGCGAMGDIPVLPTTGGIDGNATVGFSHANETASAGAYSVPPRSDENRGPRRCHGGARSRRSALREAPGWRSSSPGRTSTLAPAPRVKA
ncbi:hypothetical protein V2S66_30780 [Streptomyces sp. V4-01]|uniref:Glycosyl hydrolase family 92 N-terminal domain-containing protein n=1 Tax=Actinacidiphila polyblastidii TaxID=3110430 RepID=A0ABU7PM53_9ACTN|nr:hypothetical protein [Streptomyces sp. V4-01]